MPLRPLDEAPFLDPLDPAVRLDPGRAWADVRSKTAVARTPIGAAVGRREEVHRLLADSRLVSAISVLVRAQGFGNDGLLEMLQTTLLAMDGPEHARLRKLVAPTFTRRAADKHRDVMRTLCSELVDGFASRGACEFVGEFADRYPVQVICEVLGVPREDHGLFARWGESLTYILSLQLGAHIQEVAEAGQGLGDYVDRLVANRKERSRDDLVTSLVQASEEGDSLSPVELRTMIAGLLFAGYDTTRNQLGHAMFTFCHHPDQWALLAERPDLAPRAVDEVMRLHGAVAGAPRIATADIEVDGWLIPAGSVVFLVFASANRDESDYEDPERFDITTERTPHLTFGGGPHYCLGANLARAEMEEAFRILPGRMRDLRLAGEVAWREGTGITGPTSLPLTFRAS